MSSQYKIQDIPEGDRPRERLHRFGPEAMSTSELIAIILGSGTRSVPVMHLAQNIISHFGSLKNLCEATIEELCQISGLGKAKAIQLKAALTLGIRATQTSQGHKYKIQNPTHAYNLLKDQLENEKREHLMVILLDVKGYVITTQTVSIGTLSSSLVHPREVFYPAIRHKAASLILVHNHPSGDPTPSKQDIETTSQLVQVGKTIGIPVNDHLIIGRGCYQSLRDKGKVHF